MNIKETAAAIHANNVAKGFWDKPRELGTMLMLVTSELSEALEADRIGKRSLPAVEFNEQYFHAENVTYIDTFKTHIKDTVEDEIADAIIRLLDISEGLGIDIEFHIKHKMAYNATREKMHGKAY